MSENTTHPNIQALLEILKQSNTPYITITDVELPGYMDIKTPWMIFSFDPSGKCWYTRQG